MTRAGHLGGRTTLVYLARGADDDCCAQFDRFVRAYEAFPAGLAHDVVIIFKGFPSDASLAAGRKAFASLAYREIHTDDLGFDIGAYAAAIREIETDRVCFLNTNSEPCAHDWLLKLAVNLERPGVGLVGATGSFQSHKSSFPRFPPFPNIHVRTNAFMLRGADARKVLGSLKIVTKSDAYLAESGPESVTRRIVAAGLTSLIVGRNGRGYPPEWWNSSQTFCQCQQNNVLIHDNQTRSFETLAWGRKKQIHALTWGLGRPPGGPFGSATP